MLTSSIPKRLKVNNSIDDIRLKLNLNTNKTIMFTKKTFFYVILGFIQSYSGELSDIEGFVQLIPGN